MPADRTCLRCRKQKRRCDKILPHCTLCQRLNKRCLYGAQAAAPRLLPIPDWSELTHINLRHTLESQVSSMIGDGLRLQEASALYFRTVHSWLPILSEARYNAQLASVRVRIGAAPADFSLLTLCMSLVCKEPVAADIDDSTRSLYTSLKGFVTLFETMGTNSLATLQSRILLTIFEIGHAFYPSSYISVATNIRAAVSLGIGSLYDDSLTVYSDPQKAQEARNSWCAILVMDRWGFTFETDFNINNTETTLRDSYVSLENGQAPSAPRLPMAHEDFADVDRNPFTKLARASQLLDQVLIHVYATPPHGRFDGAEALDILISLTSFMATFRNGQLTSQPLLDSALALSRSAMLEALELGSRMEIPNNSDCVKTAVNILRSLICEFGQIGEASPPLDRETLSVFLPHFLFKAALAYLSDTRLSEGIEPESSIQPIKTLLHHLGTRWTAAKRYLQKIERVQRKCD